jgi:ribonucleoside-diphosphate reductase beta chain
MYHDQFVTTTRGINRNSPAMHLFEKAKRLGVWNPSEIDFSQDRQDWLNLNDLERDVLLRLTSLFQAGEEAVTIDLIPLVRIIGQEGRLEEEIYLTSFLWEEAKHTDFFYRFLDEVAKATPSELSRYHGPNYRSIVYEALPRALNALEMDASSRAQAIASVTYNMIVEGVLAETGYHAYFTALDRRQILPGQRQGISLLKLDESRHIAYGIFLLSRLLAEDPNLWNVINDAMNDLLIPTLGIITEVFDAYDIMPFDLEENKFIEFATRQFDKRYSRLEKARNGSLDDVYRISQAFIAEDDA